MNTVRSKKAKDRRDEESDMREELGYKSPHLSGEAIPSLFTPYFSLWR